VGASRNRNLPSAADTQGSPPDVQLRCTLVLPPASGDDWFGLTDEALPVASLYDWAVLPSCGAVVVFSGTVRDHADGREGVEQLVYEAYEQAAGERFAAITAEARRRWPTIGRLAMIHRLGALAISESAVVVAVSSPHRDEAFEAARFVIDTLKETVPIWKHETWRDGADWGTGAAPIRDVQRVGGGPG
jgi:molybdopterin synthase catalytic subunit